MKRVPRDQILPFLASKWLHIQLLVDPESMERLFATLGDVFLYQVLGPVAPEKALIQHAHFFDAYRRYVQALKEGIVSEETFRGFFTAVMTKTQEAVCGMDLEDGRILIQPVLPLLQMRPHRFVYSSVDEKFRPMVFGKTSISWGVQISYPQLFQDARDRSVHNALTDGFVNHELFRKVQAFIRQETIATPFEVAARVTRVPIRIGKSCLSWINEHRELQANHIRVVREI